MRDLFGRAIDNASEHHSVISCRVGITESVTDMNEKYADGGPFEEQQKELRKIIDESKSLHYDL